MLDINTKLRNIPAIDRLVAIAKSHAVLADVSHESMVDAMRTSVENVRRELKLGNEIDISENALVAQATQIIVNRKKTSLRRVINATGVVLHTNLGRAPLSERAANAVNEVMTGYSTLEYNVEQGERGSRYSHVTERITGLTGAEDAIVVNNNAAAVLLVLSAMAQGREVIVSRGELVEIGGSFRVPDVMKQSGASLVEVGATNKTHLYDYKNAITVNTAAILKVHTSNYRIIGFAEQPDARELRKLADEYNLPLIEDLGSGTLLPLTVDGWHEPSVIERIAAGIDVVTFSGDKLLGAGQAGIIAGKKQYISIMKKHPLLRAIRIDKLSLAALEGTLVEYELGQAERLVPIQHFLRITRRELKEKADNLFEMIDSLFGRGLNAEIIEIESQAGGGSLPGVGMASFGIGLTADDSSAASLEKRLRGYKIPIITRVQNNQVIIDVRCLMDRDMVIIREALQAIVGGEKI